MGAPAGFADCPGDLGIVRGIRGLSVGYLGLSVGFVVVSAGFLVVSTGFADYRRELVVKVMHRSPPEAGGSTVATWGATFCHHSWRKGFLVALAGGIRGDLSGIRGGFSGIRGGLSGNRGGSNGICGGC